MAKEVYILLRLLVCCIFCDIIPITRRHTVLATGPTDDATSDVSPQHLRPVLSAEVRQTFDNRHQPVSESSEFRSGFEGETRVERERHLNTLMSAANKILDFYDNVQSPLTLDAITGMIMAKDQLNVALRYIGSKNIQLSTDIRRFYQRANNIITKSTPAAAARYPDDFKGLGNLLHISFTIDASPKQIGRSHSSQRKEHCDFDEKFTDACISGLLEKKNSPTSGPPTCRLPDICLRMLVHRCDGYALTHQLLYLMVGVQNGCDGQINAGLSSMAPSATISTPVATLIDSYCADIYGEAQDFQKHGGSLDLFIEQGALCGILNYVNFFRLDWMHQLLKWQKSNGCYKEVWIPAKTEDSHTDGGTHHIQKRRDSVEEGGCSTHASSVALGYFGAFVRYLASITY